MGVSTHHAHWRSSGTAQLSAPANCTSDINGCAHRQLIRQRHWKHACTHTHTHTFNGPLSGTTRVSRYQKGKTNLDFTEARDSEWQRHQLGHVQVCTSLLTDNHASTPPLCFFTGRMPFLPPNQQRQSTEGTLSKFYRNRVNLSIILLHLICFGKTLAVSGQSSLNHRRPKLVNPSNSNHSCAVTLRFTLIATSLVPSRPRYTSPYRP